MAWDATRPVPWERLIREWLIYAGIMTAIFLVFFRGNNPLGAIAGVLISGPLYLGLGAVLAKFGYTRKRMKDLRAEARDSATTDAAPASTSASAARSKPAPTSRTAGGGNRPKSSSKRKR